MIKIRRSLKKSLAFFLALSLFFPQAVVGQSAGEDKSFKQEELDQLLAPIALYPDSLLAQIFMASTYPLEVVQAGALGQGKRGPQGRCPDRCP